MSSGSPSMVNLGSESSHITHISMMRYGIEPLEFDKLQQTLVASEEHMKMNIYDIMKEIEVWKGGFELMEKRKRDLDLEKLEIEGELKKRKREGDELRERVTRFEEDRIVESEREKRAEERYGKLLGDLSKAEADKKGLYLELRVKNTELECEKARRKRAGEEVEAWRKKVGELEGRVLKLEEDTAMLGKSTCERKQSVSNCHDEVQREGIKEKSACDDGEAKKGTSVGNGSTKLADTQIKETASHSPVSASGLLIETDGLPATGLNSGSRACDKEVLIKKEMVLEVEGSDRLIGSSVGVNKKPKPEVIIEIDDSDDEIPTVKKMTKRKLAASANICLLDDDEEENDDKPLISKRKTKQLQQSISLDKTSPGDAYSVMPDSGSTNIARAFSPSRQGPVLVGRCQGKIEAELKVRNPLSKILPDGLSSDSEDSSNSGDETSADYDLSKMHTELGKKRNNEKWASATDMLIAFQRDPELCMNAICALYRQQTSTKKSTKGPLDSGNRGFSQFDTIRGTTLAKFLVDGDPLGRLKKSILELKQYDPEGLGDCRRLATRHITQLFHIYQSKEDCFFLA